MAGNTSGLPLPQQIIDPKTGLMAQPWYLFFQTLTVLGQNLIFGQGVPPAGLGINGNFFFRSDGTVGSNLYKKTSGSWAAIL